MTPAPGERELDEVIHRAQAALRRQESEIAEVLKGVERAKAVTARAKVEIERDKAQDAAERRAEETAARTGELGPERRALQRRLDANQTTWAEVLSGRDEHETAVAYREAVGVQARKVVDRLREEDPEWGAAFDRFGPDHPVDFPEPPVDDRIDPLRPGSLDPGRPGGPELGRPGDDPAGGDGRDRRGGPPRPGGVW